MKRRKPRHMLPDPAVCAWSGSSEACTRFYDGKNGYRPILRIHEDKRRGARQCWNCKGWCTLGKRFPSKLQVVYGDQHDDSNMTFSEEALDNGAPSILHVATIRARSRNT